MVNQNQEEPTSVEPPILPQPGGPGQAVRRRLELQARVPPSLPLSAQPFNIASQKITQDLPTSIEDIFSETRTFNDAIAQISFQIEDLNRALLARERPSDEPKPPSGGGLFGTGFMREQREAAKLLTPFLDPLRSESGTAAAIEQRLVDEARAEIPAELRQIIQLQNTLSQYWTRLEQLSTRAGISVSLDAAINSQQITSIDQVQGFLGELLQSPEDIDYAMTFTAETLQNLKNMELNKEQRKEIIDRLTTSRSISTYGIATLAGAGLLNIANQLAFPELPEGVTLSDFFNILKDSGIPSDEAQRIIDENTPEIKSIVDRAIRERVFIESMQAGVAQADLDELVQLIAEQKRQNLLTRPLTALLSPAQWWIENVSRPLAGITSKGMYEIPGPGGALIRGEYSLLWGISRKEWEDFEAKYQAARLSEDNWFQTFGTAFEEWDTNGFRKFMIEVMSDPITYFGFGVYPFILRPIPRAAWAMRGIERGYLATVDYAFKGAMQGLYKVVASPKVIIRNRTLVDGALRVKELFDFESKLGTAIRYPIEQARQGLRVAVREWKLNPAGGGMRVEVGSIVMRREPVDLGKVRALVKEMDGSVSDEAIIDGLVSEIDTVVSMTKDVSTGGTTYSLGEAATLLRTKLGALHSVVNVGISKRFIRGIGEAVDARFEQLLQAKTTKNLVSDVLRQSRTIQELTWASEAYLKREQMGAISSLLVNSAAPTRAKQLAIWGTHFIERTSYGVARTYLAFALYGPWNILETAVKASLFRINVFRGEGIDTLAPWTARLQNQPASMITGRLFVPTLDIERAAARAGMAVREPTTSLNAIKKIWASNRNIASKLIGTADEALVKATGRLGEKLLNNARLGLYKRQLWKVAGPEMDTITRIIGNEERILRAFMPRQLAESYAEEALRILHLGGTDRFKVMNLASDFNPGTIHEAKIFDIVSDHPEIYPEIRDFITTKFKTPQGWKDLASGTLDKEIRAMMEMKALTQPRIIKERYGRMIQDFMDNPPVDENMLREQLRVLNEMVEVIDDTISIHLKTAQAQGREILNLGKKGAMFDDTWKQDLLPFMDWAEADATRFIEHFRGLLTRPISRGQALAERLRVVGQSANVGDRGLKIERLEVEKISDAMSFRISTADNKLLWEIGIVPGRRRGLELSIERIGEGVEGLKPIREFTFTTGELKEMGSMIAELFPDAETLHGFRMTIGRKQTEQTINLASLRDRPKAGFGIAQSDMQLYNQLLDNNLNYVKSVVKARTAQREIEEFMLNDPIVGFKAIKAQVKAAGEKFNFEHPLRQQWWRTFYGRRNAVWDVERSGMVESRTTTQFISRQLDRTDMPTIVPVLDRPITAQDIANLWGASAPEVTRGIYLPHLLALRGRKEFISKIRGRAKEIASNSGKTADELGYTEDAIGIVYDQALKDMRVMTTAEGTIVPQIKAWESVRKRLLAYSTQRNQVLKPGFDDAIRSFSRNVRDRVDRAPGLDRLRSDDWINVRQEAWDKAREDSEIMFPNYDSPTAVTQALKVGFPFATYEVHRLWYLPWTMVRFPGVYTTLGKFHNYTDFGYINIPGTSLEINLLRGTIWMGGMTRLLRRDFPDYYDTFPEFANAFDQMGRAGFYPNIWISGFFASPFSNVAGNSQIGEILPPLARLPMELLQTTFPNNAAIRQLRELILPNRFRDYITVQIVNRDYKKQLMELGITGTDILNKIQLNIDLTKDEQRLWDKAQRGTAVFSIMNDQVAMFRMRPEERKRARELSMEIIEDIMGIPPKLMLEINKSGYRVEDWHPFPPELNDALSQVEDIALWRGLTTHLRESETGQQMALISLFWGGIEEERTRIVGEQTAIDREWQAGIIFFTEWNFKRRELNEEIPKLIETRRKEPQFVDVPIELDERIKWAEKHNTLPPILHPEEELIQQLFKFSPEDFRVFDPNVEAFVTDWNGFFKWRNVIENALPEPYRTNWLNKIRQWDTPLETIRRDDYENYIQPYRNLFDFILQDLPGDEQRIIKIFYFTDDADEEAAMREQVDSEGNKIVSKFNTILKEAREAMRILDPELDARLVFWNEVSQPKTDRAREIWRELRVSRGFSVFELEE